MDFSSVEHFFGNFFKAGAEMGMAVGCQTLKGALERPEQLLLHSPD